MSRFGYAPPSRGAGGAWLLASLVLLVGACTAAPGATTAATVTSSTHQPTSTSVAAGTTTSTSTTAESGTTELLAGEVALVDELKEWGIIAGPSEDIRPGFDFDGDSLVFQQRTDLGEETLMVARNGIAREVHRTPRGWSINDALLDSGRLALVEFAEADGSYRVWVYDLDDTVDPLLIEEGGATSGPFYVPLISHNAGYLAWTAIRDGQSCVVVRDLGEGTQLDVACVSYPARLLDWPTLRWPYLSYTLIDQSIEPICRELVVADLPTGTPVSYGSTGCRVHSGAADSEVVAWTEEPEPDLFEGEAAYNFFSVAVNGLEPDGAVASLGTGVAGSLTVCEGRAYWLFNPSDADEGEIRAWTPGRPVEVIYRSPDQGDYRRYATSKPHCIGGIVTVERSSWEAGAPDEILATGMPVDELPRAVEPDRPESSELDPTEYVTALRARETPGSWTRSLSDAELIGLAEGFCDDLALLAPAERFGAIDNARGRYMSETGMKEFSEYMEWLQTAFPVFCPENYQYVGGN